MDKTEKPVTTNAKKSRSYDMGNIGDLLKHGVIAEFIRWWSINQDKKNFVFLDPFCGRSYEEPNSNVIDRLERLKELGNKRGQKFEIINAQSNSGNCKYYGSTHVALRQIDSCGLLPDILISDKKINLVNNLTKLNSNIKKIECEHFYPSNGYSILDSINEEKIYADMVLIDPFENMEEIRQCACSIFTASKRTAVVLFVLINDHTKWKKIQAELPEYSIILTCPRLENTGIHGESKYTVKVILASHLLANTKDGELLEKLKSYADALTDIVNEDSLDKKIITCE